MYYDPMQLYFLQANRGNPAMLANLRAAFSRVKPIDDAAIETEANAKKSEFLSGSVAPELAKIVAGDGNQTGSFGAARQAYMAQEGQRRAQDVYAAARSAAMERELAMHRMQQQDENDAWNDYMGQDMGGYSGGSPGMVNAQVGRANAAQGNLDRWIEGGTAAVNGIGRMFAQGNPMSVSNPVNKFNSILSGALGKVGSAFGVATKPVTSQYTNNARNFSGNMYAEPPGALGRDF